jgi:hypothetical protein
VVRRTSGTPTLFSSALRRSLTDAFETPKRWAACVRLRVWEMIVSRCRSLSAFEMRLV